MRDIKRVIIARTNIDSEKENIEILPLITKYDLKLGLDNIFAHYLINHNGDIINCNDEDISIGLDQSQDNDYIVIRLVCNDITNKQIYSMYAVLYELYTRYGLLDIKNGSIINKLYDNKLDEYIYFNNIIMLYNMETNAIKEYKNIKAQINTAEKLANDLINNNIYSCKNDILQSKYYKMYKFGIKKYQNIVNNHYKNEDELIEISDERYLFAHNAKIPISIYNYIMEISEKYNLDPFYLFETIYRENTYIINKKNHHIIRKNNKEYTYILDLFYCWSIIKKTFPSSKTVKIIKKYNNKANLNKDELKELLTAYILLSEESKTIKDYDKKNVIINIYNEIINGTYLPGNNHVSGKYQINLRNVMYFFFKNYNPSLNLSDYNDFHISNNKNMYKVGYLVNDYDKLPDPTKLTHIVYCFAELYMSGDKYNHFEIEGDYNNLKKVINLKKINPNLKVLLGFTSWIKNKDNKQEGGFSSLCAYDVNIIKYCNDCKDFLDKYNLDGVLINWEYPGLKWHNQKPRENDNNNFDILIKYLRSTMPYKTIGVAGNYDAYNKYFNVNVLDKYVDFMTVMLYDIHEGIYGDAHNGISDIIYSINSYKECGFNMNKYILGIPCYGRLHFDSKKYPNRPKTLSIKYIKSKEYPYFIKNINKMPWLLKYNENNNIEHICSFEDEISIREKIKIIKDNGLLGISIWSMNLDELDDYNILNTINNIEKEIM